MQNLFNLGLVISVLITSLLVVLISIFLLYFSAPLIFGGEFKEFFTLEWDPLNSFYGLMPMVIGTASIASLATLFAIVSSFSFAVLILMFLPKSIASFLEKFLYFLSGVPTVLYAFVALFLLIPFANDVLDGKGLSILSASFVLSFVIFPTISIFLLNSFKQVAKKSLFAAKSLGATKEDLFFNLILKSSKKGVLSAIIFGFARAVGDTMVALMIAGNSLKIPNSLLDSARTLTAHIALINANDYESTAFKALFLSGLLLFLFSFATVAILRILTRSKSV